ncbi:MAG: FHA domain-containing protein [Planctomycetia bacterium]|nr:FHA domain-containing protein [Planctomycetia bacterium]
MDVKLIVAEGKHTGQEIPVKKNQFFIGKSQKCHLRPGGTNVSDIHCVILQKEGYVGIKDLNSASGTFVNEERVQKEISLKNGDKLRIGTLLLEVQLTVGVSGDKKPKVRSISEAASRVSQKKQTPQGNGEDIDIFAIFEEERPSEEDLPSFIHKKKHTGESQAVENVRESDLEKEKKMQESTRNAAADTIKAILGQAIKK